MTSLEDTVPQTDRPDQATGSISTQRVGELVDAVAGDAPTPGGGAVAGTVAALGAALVGMAGRYAGKHDPASPLFRELVLRSDRLRARAAALADDDAAAYGRYLEAVRRKGDPDARRTAIRLALDTAADVPLELAHVAAEVAAAGEQLATYGAARMRPDACAAALLGSAVAASAAVLVADNLHDRPDGRVAAARRDARAARAAADRALSVSGYAIDAPDRVAG